jgi:diguanylate cyclase (GGDEF)-like protein
MSVGALLILVGVAGFFLVKESKNEIIQQQALTVAEIVARHASAVRSVYSEDVVNKLKKDGTGSADINFHETAGNVPLPAQFTRSISSKAFDDSDGLYKYRLISKWNIAKGQGLTTEFLKSAWDKLEQQNLKKPSKPIEWQSSHEILNLKGKQTLLYMKADPAVSESCVACHNAYELTEEIKQRRVEQGIAPGKQWEKHQLMGAFFVEIPLSGIQSAAVKKSTESVVWILLILTAGLILMAYFLVGDVAKVNEKSKKLFWQARHDALTNLPNRFHFEEKTAELIEDARETGHTHFMCYLDLDRFKVVNDSCGHAAGDELLSQIAKELALSLKKTDTLARLGGDEFGVLLENSSITRAETISKSLCKHVKNYHYVFKDKAFDIGVSIGLVEISARTKSVEEVFSQADIACYAAKDSGRNRVQLYREHDSDIATRSSEISWVSRILIALEEKRLVIFAQKISSVSKESKHSHFEILVRLMDSHGKIVPPNEFLPAAERYDLMKKIDNYVIEQALDALNKNCFKGLGKTDFISINLSGQSLSDETFLDSVNKLLDKYEVDPRKVCFEITETSAIKNPRLVRRFMYTLKSRGVRFALDDFGTGLSSLTYLKQFPVDYLKIDGSFVRDIINNSVDRKLVSAINQLAHTMNIKTIAEYVETPEILALLDEMDVDYAQGFFIDKPEAVEEPTEELIEEPAI